MVASWQGGKVLSGSARRSRADRPEATIHERFTMSRSAIFSALEPAVRGRNVLTTTDIGRFRRRLPRRPRRPVITTD